MERDIQTAKQKSNWPEVYRMAREGQVLASSNQKGWTWKFRLLEALSWLGCGNPDQGQSLLLEPPPRDVPDYAILEATRLKLIGTLCLGTPDESYRFLLKAEDLALQNELWGLLAELEYVFAFVYNTPDLIEGKEYSWSQALHYAKISGNAESIAERAYLNLGHLRIQQSRFEDAVPFLLEGLEVSTRINGPNQGNFQTNLGTCYNRLGQFELALDILDEARVFHEARGNFSSLHNTLGEMGNCAFFQDQWPAAARYFEEAFQVSKAQVQSQEADKWAGNLASALIELGDWDNAEVWNERARQLKIAAQKQASLIYLTLNDAEIAAGRGFETHAAENYNLVAKDAARDNLKELHWSALAGLGRLYFRAGDWAQANRAFKASLELIEEASADIGQLDRNMEMSHFSRMIRLFDTYIEVLIQQEKAEPSRERALELVESAKARVLVDRLYREELGHIFTQSADLKKASMNSDAYYLSYWLNNEHSFLWFLHKGKLEFRHIDVGKLEIEDQVKRYRGAIEAEEASVITASGGWLWRTLIAAVAQKIPIGSRVVIIPQGALCGLPFDTLRADENAPFWLERVNVAVSPSLTLTLSSPAATGLGSRRLLLVGDPLVVDSNFPQLRNAHQEMTAIAADFGGTAETLSGADANPAALVHIGLARFDAIHFTCHALALRQSPLDSFLVLSRDPGSDRYRFTARELLERELKLNAGLVTVSACSSAGTKAYAGEGLVGFAWAFLQAGARRVVAGLWDVDDAATSKLMTQFYKSLGEGLAPEEALREAKLGFIAGSHGISASQPFYWAGFQIFMR